MEEFLRNHAHSFEEAEIYLCLRDEFNDMAIDIDFTGKTILIGDCMKLDYNFNTGKLVKIYITPAANLKPEGAELVDYE